MTRRTFGQWLAGAVFSCVFPSPFKTVEPSRFHLEDWQKDSLSYLGFPFELGDDWIRWQAPRDTVPDFDSTEAFQRMQSLWDLVHPGETLCPPGKPRTESIL